MRPISWYSVVVVSQPLFVSIAALAGYLADERSLYQDRDRLAYCVFQDTAVRGDGIDTGPAIPLPHWYDPLLLQWLAKSWQYIC